MFVPVTTHANLVRSLPRDALRALINGTIRNWHELGHPDDLPVLRVSVEQYGYQLAEADRRVPDVAALTRLSTLGLFALIEPDATAASLRVLSVDGRDLFRSPGIASQVPELVEWLVLDGPTHLLPIDTLSPEPLSLTPRLPPSPSPATSFSAEQSTAS